MNGNTTTLILALLFGAVFCGALRAQPTAFTYQGQLMDGEALGNGLYDLRFELFDAETNGASLGEVTSLETQVTEGRFTVALDFGTGVFEGEERWLEIAAKRSESEESFTALSPRQRLTATPYALSALSSGGVSAGAISSAMLANGAVTAEKIGTEAVTRPKIEPGAVSQLGTPDGSDPATVQVSEDGLLGVGTAKPAAGLHLASSASFVSLDPKLQVSDGTDGYDNLRGATDVAGDDRLIAVAARFDNAVTLVDVTLPFSPELQAQIKDGEGGFEHLGGARGVALFDDLLAVAASFDDAVTLVDVSDPENPALHSVLRDGVGDFNDLDGAADIEINGDLLAVASFGDDAVTLVDVSDPSAPQFQATLKDGTFGFNEIEGVSDLSLSGDLLAIASFGDDAATLVDVSDPSNPALQSVIKNGNDGIEELNSASAVAMSGDLLAVASRFDHAVTLVNIANPANPELLSVVLDGADGFDHIRNPRGLAFLDTIFSDTTLAIIAPSLEEAVTLVDVSDPQNPKPLAIGIHGAAGLRGLENPQGVTFENELLVVADEDSDTLSILERDRAFVGLASDEWVGIGTRVPVAPLHVEGNLVVTNAEDVNLQAERFSTGERTVASGKASTATGSSTTASGFASSAFGRFSRAAEAYSFAAGHKAEALHSGSFVWADRGGDPPFETFSTTNENQFLIRAEGGVGIGINKPEFLFHVNGEAGKPGGGSWSSASDGRLKEVGPSFNRGLEALEQIEPKRYRYAEGNPLDLPSDREYVGLVAQDVQPAIPEAIAPNDSGYLHLNNDPILWTMLNSINELNEKLESDVTRLQTDNTALRQRLQKLEKRLNALIEESGK